ncbi:MAG TPA: PSD1 and planctomycete cytochrome C domain-containing protein [Pirellulaceae bacterium]|nr:PSD1 and planctomycete cytochrome C domain-containing protein [Pirellulaceae bacterium]
MLVGVLATLAASGASTAFAAETPDDARAAVAILRRECFECHGAAKQEGGLRLDDRAPATRGGDSGPAIIAGRPTDGELLRRVARPRGDDGAMPPRGPGLTDADLAKLRKWIADGANWPARAANDAQDHWAYSPPRRSPPPDLTASQRRAWTNHPVDRFIAQRLIKENLPASPLARPETQLRRLSFDLRGLPPSPEEVDEFMREFSQAHARPRTEATGDDDREGGDSQGGEHEMAVDAYDRWVDRLIASPEYGVRWARPWLDLARYADSHGFQRDDLRELWAYRDWVVAALNADMPFDQFTIEQVAGDLLPSPTQQQLIATGFHRCTPTNVEAGTEPEESRVNQVFDRVNTTGAVWLGTTLECAQCHDHKYDPFTQRDYYRLFAYFNNTEQEAARANPKVPGSIKFLGPSLTIGEKQSTLVMRELPAPRMSAVYERGEYLQAREPVAAGTPAALPSLDESPNPAPNRLTLARWLVDARNPLTARVVANRWWSELFGHGLVTTPEDFGLRGERPTHPELLDWLAVDLVEHGWSQKRFVRQVVSSRTYRQSSVATPEMLERDDRNLLYARGPRVRLDAEAIRDNALAIAGQLSRAKGGPSIRPPQPAGLWKKVGGEQYDYKTSDGEARYRRGLYVVLKRSAPNPTLANFDAPSRLACVVSRSRSNTPLQALTLLNDPVFVEAAEALADALHGDTLLADMPDANIEARIEHAFLRAVGRRPTQRELSVLARLVAADNDESTAPQSTAPPTSHAARAGWRRLATVLLNLDETITKN